MIHVLVVDTNVVSYGFRQDPLFVGFYGPAIEGHEAVVSFMTVAEIEYGMMRRGWGVRQVQGLRDYLSGRYAVYGTSRELIDAWARLTNEARSSGRVLSTSDGWIAATADVLGVPLVTHNDRDFSYLGSIEVVTAPNG